MCPVFTFQSFFLLLFRKFEMGQRSVKHHELFMGVTSLELSSSFLANLSTPQNYCRQSELVPYYIACLLLTCIMQIIQELGILVLAVIFLSAPSTFICNFPMYKYN